MEISEDITFEVGDSVEFYHNVGDTFAWVKAEVSEVSEAVHNASEKAVNAPHMMNKPNHKRYNLTMSHTANGTDKHVTAVHGKLIRNTFTLDEKVHVLKLSSASWEEGIITKTLPTARGTLYRVQLLTDKDMNSWSPVNENAFTTENPQLQDQLLKIDKVNEDPIKSKFMELANVPSHNIRRWNYESKAITSAKSIRKANSDLEATLSDAKTEVGFCLPANANSYRKVDTKAAAADCCATCCVPPKETHRNRNFLNHLLSYELGILVLFGIKNYSEPSTNFVFFQSHM